MVSECGKLKASVRERGMSVGVRMYDSIDGRRTNDENIVPLGRRESELGSGPRVPSHHRSFQVRCVIFMSGSKSSSRTETQNVCNVFILSVTM